MPRLTKIYTRKGDDGSTQLANRTLPKDDLLIEALGTIDELNAFLGVLITHVTNEPLLQILTQIQQDLFNLGAEFHAPEYRVITSDKVKELEMHLDRYNATLPVLQEFVLPRGDQATTACHVARTVARRAERLIVKLHRQTPLQNSDMLPYLNRLSDLLFVFARVLNKSSGGGEILWNKKKE